MFKSRLAAALLAAAVALPISALAQPAPAAPPAGVAPTLPNGQHAHRGSRYMRAMRTLDLSDAQKQQIRSIMQNARQSNQNVTDPAQRRANMEKVHAQIEAVLTPQQRTQLRDELAKQPQATAPQR